MLRSEKTSVFRFNHELPPHLPLAVRSSGSYTMVPGSQEEAPQVKWFSQIFWSEEGEGEFVLSRRRIRVRGSGVFYLLPGEVHDIRPVSRPWTYHWLTLDHHQSAGWLEAFGFTRRPLPARECPVGMFRTLQELVGKGTPAGDREAAHQAHGVLLAALEGSLAPLSKPHSSWVEACRRRMDEDYADPQLNVAAMAEAMQVHRATLFRAFVAAHGMTPSSYLQNRRLHQAMELLKASDTPIKDVARRVGMNDANYLARLIRRVTGVSPRRFRAGYRQGTVIRP